MADGIQVNGKVFAVCHPDTRHPIPVLAWNDAAGSIRVPEFKAGDGFNKKRTHDIELVVWHWTGGEREPDAMAEVLRKRKLGVEFAISRLGVIFQFCDPAYVDTADAGTVNYRSVGVEMVSYGYRRFLRMVPKLGKDRLIYDADTHGRVVKTARFYAHQVTSACALADALSDALGVPRETPDADGVYAPALARDGTRFKGHVGHYHVSKRKRDPGPMFMDELHDHFNGLS